MFYYVYFTPPSTFQLTTHPSPPSHFKSTQGHNTKKGNVGDRKGFIIDERSEYKAGEAEGAVVVRVRHRKLVMHIHYLHHGYVVVISFFKIKYVNCYIIIFSYLVSKSLLLIFT